MMMSKTNASATVIMKSLQAGAYRAAKGHAKEATTGPPPGTAKPRPDHQEDKQDRMDIVRHRRISTMVSMSCIISTITASPMAHGDYVRRISPTLGRRGKPPGNEEQEEEGGDEGERDGRENSCRDPQADNASRETSMAPIRNSTPEIRPAAASGDSSTTVPRRIPSSDDADSEAEKTALSRADGGGEHLHHAHLATASRASSPSGGPPWAVDQGSVTDDNRVGIH